MAVYKYETENGIEWGFKIYKALDNSMTLQIECTGFKSIAEALEEQCRIKNSFII